MKYFLFSFLAILMKEVTIGQCLPASNGIYDGTPKCYQQRQMESDYSSDVCDFYLGTL
ncbi:MAG: hypothetical protein ABIO44_09360 [Saprospiraceae bacterium]